MTSAKFGCKLDEIPSDKFKIIDFEKVSIGLINFKGAIKAYLNICPHAGAPVCIGNIDHLIDSHERHQLEIVEENAILKCPWHGYEFKIKDGSAILDSIRGLRSVKFEIRADSVFLFV